MSDLPNSRETEEALVGAALVSQSAYTETSAIVEPGDFFLYRHRWVWDAIGRLVADEQPVDIITVTSALERSGKLDDVGGPAYLTTLINQVPSFLNAEAYARSVRELADRRAVIAAATAVVTDAYNDEMDTGAVLSGARERMEAVVNRSHGTVLPTLADTLGTVVTEIEARRQHPTDVWGIPTGLPFFDAFTGGQHMGELSLLSGEPGAGKTWLALGMSLHMANALPGVFISLEMSRESIVRRAIAGLAAVPVRRMKTGRWQDGDRERIDAARKSLDACSMYITDQRVDLYKLRRLLLDAKRERGIRWFVLDYLMLVDERARDEIEFTARVSAALKKLCMELELAGLVLHSVNKQGMDKGEGQDVGKANLRGSGQVIHDADNIFYLTTFRPDSATTWVRDEDKDRIATLFIKKGRELENNSRWFHLVRRGDSPFFGELDIQGHTMPGQKPAPIVFEEEVPVYGR